MKSWLALTLLMSIAWIGCNNQQPTDSVPSNTPEEPTTAPENGNDSLLPPPGQEAQGRLPENEEPNKNSAPPFQQKGSPSPTPSSPQPQTEQSSPEFPKPQLTPADEANKEQDSSILEPPTSDQE